MPTIIKLLLPAVLLFGSSILPSSKVSAKANAPTSLWSAQELALIQSLALAKNETRLQDPSNRYERNPLAAQLGKALFNDTRFSANQQVSCATCHLADYDFTDKLALAKGLGQTSRRSMPLTGVAGQKWFFWDGRVDSLWSQALGPLENPLEHGITRTQVFQLIQQHYLTEYQALFSEVAEVTLSDSLLLATPNSDDEAIKAAWTNLDEKTQVQINQVFVNVGKSIAAFVSTLNYTPTSFDHYAWGLNKGNTDGQAISKQAVAGLKLFIGKGKCINCHNGPRLSNGEFHNVGISGAERGRAEVLATLKSAEFNCQSRWSDIDSANKCLHLRFLDLEEKIHEGSFKTPSLRNVAIRPPYMHAGQFKTLSEVLENYQKVSASQSLVSDEIIHETLTKQEMNQLIAFLQILTSLQ